MSRQWNILHLSDFHLHDPADRREHLRKGHFDEFLHDLGVTIRKEIAAKLDCLVITGDFVNFGRVDNFGHAGEVIRFALKEFDLSAGQVIVCPGNHDLNKDDEEGGRALEARAAYHAFANQWANGATIKAAANKRTLLCKLRDDLWVLPIDSTLGANGRFIPGPGSWVDGESPDEALGWVKEHIHTPDELLVVLSHYPVEEFQGSLVPEEEEDFSSRHIWVKGKELAMRIGKWRGESAAKTLWLSGDVHAEYRTSCYGIDFVTAGRFGTRVGKDSQQPRQAKLIQIGNDGARTKVSTFNYKMPGHADRNACGVWSVESSSIPSIRSPKGKKLCDPKAKSNEFVIPENPNAGQQEPVVETIDRELEERIIGRIAERKLYSVGRFETNETDTSLAWVSIGPLLNTTGILPVTIRGMYEWLNAKFEVTRHPTVFDKVLLLGIDCWGAVIASQLSILTGARNVPVASRGSGLHYTEHERISERVIEYVKSSVAVVLVHDVVGTGRSLWALHEQIEAKLGPDETRNIRWLALSVISDNARSRAETCGFLGAHGTACGSLRMPILPKSHLPNERILQPQLSFHHSV